jgi:hypothetical protein
VDSPGLVTNLGGPWTPVNGRWTTTGSGAVGNSAGDTFLISDQTGTDFSYEGDVTIVNGTAAALTFRADATGAGYSANVDSAGLVKLWRPGRDIATATTPIRQNQRYHLRVVAAGPRIQIWLDNAPTPIVDATDTAYAGGHFAANVFNGTGIVQNLTVTP